MLYHNNDHVGTIFGGYLQLHNGDEVGTSLVQVVHLYKMGML